MDLRVLRYFLTVVREESIIGAADVLHLTQPTLSRQLKELEEEFGTKLFLRGNKSQKISLTEKGMLLRRRAEELVELADRTQLEMNIEDQSIRGDIIIGCGESHVMRIIAKAANELKTKYPEIHYHLYSGNAEDVKERLEKGLLDFGVFVEPTDLQKYETIRLPAVDHWGLLVHIDSPLAEKKTITPEDLLGIPLIISRQQRVFEAFEGWSGITEKQLNIVATYNLLYNAALMVEEGFGSALCLDKLINTSNSEKLRFIPMNSPIEVHLDMAWKKYQMINKASNVFLEKIQACFVQNKTET